MIALTEISALLQVVMVDLVLAGDNALVVGMVAASVAREDRAKAIMIGIVAATLMRVVFAVITAQLLQIIGLTLAGVARQHTWVLVVGLVLSVAFMGAAASLIAGLLHRLHWLSYIGLGIIIFVACHMIFDGTADVWGIARRGW